MSEPYYQYMGCLNCGHAFIHKFEFGTSGIYNDTQCPRCGLNRGYSTGPADVHAIAKQPE